MIEGIDAWILTQVERFSHWFQDWFGKDNFWLARNVIHLKCLISIGYLFLFHGTEKIENEEFVIGIIYFVSTYILYCSALWLCKHRMSTAKGFRNHMAINPSWVLIRILILGLCFLAWLCALWQDEEKNHLAILYGYTERIDLFVLYLISCTPKPPCSAKFKDFLRELFSARNLQPASAS